MWPRSSLFKNNLIDTILVVQQKLTILLRDSDDAAKNSGKHKQVVSKTHPTCLDLFASAFPTTEPELLAFPLCFPMDGGGLESFPVHFTEAK